MYKVILGAKAQKEYKKLPTATARVIKQVIFVELRESPYSRTLDVKKLKVPLDGFRLRVGDYRVLFDVEGEWIKVYSIRHRKDAYR